MSGLQQQLLVVDQLRREAAIKRINVSQAVEDIKVGHCTQLVRRFKRKENTSTAFG